MTVSLLHTTPADGTFSSAGAVAWDAEHTLTLATGNLLGRSTAGTGAAEEISIGTGLSLSGGTLTNTVTATAPGGSTTQIQYNNAGSFAGASGLTTNGTELTIASGTKTASAPALNMTQTWNNAAVTFTGLKLNVTDTASNAASLLMDLQVSSSSKFSVSKFGVITAANRLDVQGISVCYQGLAGTLAWSGDAFITRRAAANLRIGALDAAAPVAQTLSVQSVVAGTSNTAGANLTITGSQGTGTGAGGSIIFQVAPAGSSGSAQNSLVDALTIDSARNVVIPLVDNSSTLRLGGATSGTTFQVDEDGSMQIRRLNSTAFGLSIGTRGGGVGSVLGLGAITTFAWSSVNQPDGDSTYDVLIGRSAAGVMALVGNSTGGAVELTEMTAPAAGAANTVRIYAEDNGAGKTRLMALFATGAAQQIAIEP